MFFRDPIPTPAARCGRAAIACGLTGWFCCTIAALLYWASLSTADDNNLSATFRIACGWTLGPAIIAFLLGMIYVAAGLTRRMNRIPDPGMRGIIIGFLLCACPMTIVATGAAYDKVGRRLLEPEPPEPEPRVYELAPEPRVVNERAPMPRELEDPPQNADQALPTSESRGAARPAPPSPPRAS